MGISVPYYDVDAWENALRYLLEHPEDVQKMGRNARALAERKFNLENTSKTIADALLSNR